MGVIDSKEIERANEAYEKVKEELYRLNEEVEAINSKISKIEEKKDIISRTSNFHEKNKLEQVLEGLKKELYSKKMEFNKTIKISNQIQKTFEDSGLKDFFKDYIGEHKRREIDENLQVVQKLKEEKSALYEEKNQKTSKRDQEIEKLKNEFEKNKSRFEKIRSFYESNQELYEHIEKNRKSEDFSGMISGMANVDSKLMFKIMDETAKSKNSDTLQVMDSLVRSLEVKYNDDLQKVNNKKEYSVKNEINKVIEINNQISEYISKVEYLKNKYHDFLKMDNYDPKDSENKISELKRELKEKEDLTRALDVEMEDIIIEENELLNFDMESNDAMVRIKAELDAKILAEERRIEEIKKEKEDILNKKFDLEFKNNNLDNNTEEIVVNSIENDNIELESKILELEEKNFRLRNKEVAHGEISELKIIEKEEYEAIEYGKIKDNMDNLFKDTIDEIENQALFVRESNFFIKMINTWRTNSVKKKAEKEAAAIEDAFNENDAKVNDLEEEITLLEAFAEPNFDCEKYIENLSDEKKDQVKEAYEAVKDLTKEDIDNKIKDKRNEYSDNLKDRFNIQKELLDNEYRRKYGIALPERYFENKLSDQLEKVNYNDYVEDVKEKNEDIKNRNEENEKIREEVSKEIESNQYKIDRYTVKLDRNNDIIEKLEEKKKEQDAERKNNKNDIDINSKKLENLDIELVNHIDDLGSLKDERDNLEVDLGRDKIDTNKEDLENRKLFNNSEKAKVNKEKEELKRLIEEEQRKIEKHKAYEEFKKTNVALRKFGMTDLEKSVLISNAFQMDFRDGFEK